MARFTGTGTCVSVSIGVPATHDAAGFAALTYTTVGELESVPEAELGHALVSFQNLCTGKTSIAKGAEEQIEIALGVAMDRDDAGQALMTTARKSLTQVMAVRIVDNAGDTQYFRGLVLGERIFGGAGANDIRMGQYRLGVVAPATGDTIVVVNGV